MRTEAERSPNNQKKSVIAKSVMVSITVNEQLQQPLAARTNHLSLSESCGSRLAEKQHRITGKLTELLTKHSPPAF